METDNRSDVQLPDGVLAAILASPEATAARQAEKLRRRRVEQTAERGQLHQERARELRQLEQGVEQAAQAFAEQLPRYNAALAKSLEAQAAYDYARASFSSRIAAVESFLIETSTPLIARFHARLVDEHERTRRVHPTTNEIDRRTSLNGTITIRFKTDQPAIAQRLSAIVEAMRELPNWRLDADQTNLEQRFEALLARLPQGAGAFVEVIAS